MHVNIFLNVSDGTVVDLGIFVKSVLHGGAASRDGRLKTNDQLVNLFSSLKYLIHFSFLSPSFSQCQNSGFSCAMINYFFILDLKNYFSSSKER
jgi:hypothetical protein